VDTNIYRLDMDHIELETLKNIIKGDGHINQTALQSLNEKISEVKIIKRSEAKIQAAIKATDIKIQQTKDKIENGINIQRLENKKFTHYSIAKSSGVSINTVKKYIDDDRLKSLNDLILKG